MKIITISREFGSGGRELGKRLADVMGFCYYDKEIITAVAEEVGMNEHYIEKSLNRGFVSAFPFTFHHTMVTHSVNPIPSAELLIAQKKVIEAIADKGEDFVIVGRNADIILKNRNPFQIFVHADMPSKIKRCMQQAEPENLSEKELEKNIKKIDTARLRTRELLSGDKWGAKENYHLTINTTNRNIKELVVPTKEFADSFFRRTI